MTLTSLDSKARRLVARGASAVRAAMQLAIGLLRELGDENAYARFLAATGRTRSRESWRHFTDERLRAKYVRPKCC